MKTRILALAIVAGLATTALADIAGGPVYYCSQNSVLWRNDNPWNQADTQIGNLPAQMTDIAFSHGTSDLYGVTFSRFYSIDPATGSGTNLAPVPYPMNALASYATNKFYGAVDGQGGGGINGHFYDMTWNPGTSTLTATDRGQYHDANNTEYLSAGDIWVSGNTVYATINDLTNTNGWLATVDPNTALVTLLVSLPNVGDAYGLAESNGVLYVLRNSTQQVYELQGNSLLDTGFTTSQGAYGATAIPVPAAALLGVIGLGSLCALRRRITA